MHLIELLSPLSLISYSINLLSWFCSASFFPHYFDLYVTNSFLCFLQPAVNYIKPVLNLAYCILHIQLIFLNNFIYVVRVSPISSNLFLSPENILMIFALNSPSHILVISVLLRSLGIASSCFFIWVG